YALRITHYALRITHYALRITLDVNVSDETVWVTQSQMVDDSGLAALTLLVAESEPNQKGTIIRLIMNMLATEKQ
ncbi:hypothetical protein, partial [Vibrio splendidus]|uniref:hypothetical protein n=1 Tax=Vibrio splendidus TaxID=29497 RepID=UPI0035984152